MTTAKAYKGLPMEGMIASWYTNTTSRDLKRHKHMAARLAPKIPAHGRVLEIAPGPGFFCIELARLGDYRITGLDISREMIEQSQKKHQRLQKRDPGLSGRIDWQVADGGEGVGVLLRLVLRQRADRVGRLEEPAAQTLHARGVELQRHEGLGHRRRFEQALRTGRP